MEERWQVLGARTIKNERTDFSAQALLNTASAITKI